MIFQLVNKRTEILAIAISHDSPFMLQDMTIGWQLNAKR